jgi:CheY-like chemotaxis protein
VPKTLLAVDDSVTMRKVLEITFGGEDFSVITAEGRDEALGKLAEKPNVVLIDAGEDWGYALAKDVRAKNPGAAIVMLSSRFSPYDAAKGKEAGADENIEKPFDTAQAIDKVKKALAARESGQPVAASAPAPAPVAAAAAPASVAAKPAPAPAAAKPAAAAKAPEPVKPAAAAAPKMPPVATTNGKHMAAKLADLGLNPAQVDAVMALSRQVIEEVVWEVVPTLAATMIREEISRLTKE